MSKIITYIKLPEAATQALHIGDNVWVKGEEWRVNKIVRNKTGYHTQLEREPDPVNDGEEKFEDPHDNEEFEKPVDGTTIKEEF